MAELADERGGLSSTLAVEMSPEKQLQLETYGEALAVHLERQRLDRTTTRSSGSCASGSA